MAFAEVGGYELESLAAAPQEAAVGRMSAEAEDQFWVNNFWKEPYFRADYDYEDYAPAYCVGYSGCAQYGGSFDLAEQSLRANFVRIKGDSRLSWEEAVAPIQAAWRRVEGEPPHGLEWELNRALEQVSRERCAVPA